MATYYPTSTNHQRNHVFPSSYLSTQQQLNSYQESPCPPTDIMYQNHNSTDPSFLDLLSGQTQSNPENLSGVENHQELSLSLGMQITTSSMDLPSFQYNYLNPHVLGSSDHGSQSNKVDNVDFLSFNRPMNNVQCSISGDYQIPSGVVPRIYNSRYLKPSQELLEEVVNIHEALRQLKMNKHTNPHKFDENNSKIELTTSSSGELSSSEKTELQNKLAKLFSLLDEVQYSFT